MDTFHVVSRKVTSNKTTRSSLPEVFLGKGVLKIRSKFTGGHPCRSAISISLQSNFIEISLRHGYSPVNLLRVLRTPFPKNTSGRLLLDYRGISANLFHDEFRFSESGGTYFLCLSYAENNSDKTNILNTPYATVVAIKDKLLVLLTINELHATIEINCI